MEYPAERRKKIRFVDPHMHADILHHVSPEDFLLYEHNGAAISWSYVHEPKTWEEYPAYFDFLRELSCSISQKNFPLYYLVGVHPRSLPLENTAAVAGPLFWSGIAAHVTVPSCLGLGELGLETGSQREVSMLKEQLVWAASFLPLDKRIGIHTPRAQKARMTAVILDLLDQVPALHPRIVIDHVCEENLEMVRDSGLMMGMTMQEGKMTLGILTAMLEKHPELEDRIMVNSDSALKLSPEYRNFVTQGENGISDTVYAKLIRGNACRFWGIGT